MTDIVKMLRSIDHMSVEDCLLQIELERELGRRSMFAKAADEIERLRAEGDKARARGDKLRMALEDIAYPNPLHNEDNLMNIARAALEVKHD